MPRTARKKSSTGIYHIMLRGINQQTIFNAKEDYTRFLNTLKKFKSVSGYKIYAYCLMTNHIHILIKAENEDMDMIMKRIAGSYVYWYNLKYHRSGHLFQDRFRSEPVEDDVYFMTVLRYIHQNPLKAGMVKNIGDYNYSSYNEYVTGEEFLIDSEFVFSMSDKKAFIEFNNEVNTDKCLDIGEQSVRKNDDDVKAIIKDKVCEKNLSAIGKKDEEKLQEIVNVLVQEGLSIRQISENIGISVWNVRKIMKNLTQENRPLV